jgi:phosphonate transport system substrate-binding protein
MPPRPLIRLLCAFAVVAASCSRQAESDQAPSFGEQPIVDGSRPEYIFACHPLHNPARLFEVYQPLVDLINSKTSDFTLKLESSQNYADFEQKLAARHLHFALPNPLQTVRAEQQGYRIFAKMGDDARFRGLILVRKDAGLTAPTDLRGAPISFPAPTAVAACLMPKLFLKEHGLDVEKDAEPRYVGSQESSIMNVFQGITKAGCTWPPPWETFARDHPDVAAALEVKWETEPLVNNGLVVRDDVPAAHLGIVRETILGLHLNAPGKAILARMALSQYEAADSSTYEPMRVFLTRYEQAFGAIAKPQEKP